MSFKNKYQDQKKKIFFFFFLIFYIYFINFFIYPFHCSIQGHFVLTIQIGEDSIFIFQSSKTSFDYIRRTKVFDYERGKKKKLE